MQKTTRTLVAGLIAAAFIATPTADPVMEIQSTVFKDHKDAYGAACKMKW